MYAQTTSQHDRTYRYIDLVMALFVTVLIVRNIASSAKIVDWGISIPLINLRLAFDRGTILFPISYIFGDLLTEIYGCRRSRRVIWTGFACLTISTLSSGNVASCPAKPPGSSMPGKAPMRLSWAG